MSTRMLGRRGSRHRIHPDEFYEAAGGGANGIPNWENPAALPSKPEPPRRTTSSRLKKPPPLSTRVPTDGAVTAQSAMNESVENFENMVIECDYSDMSSDLSIEHERGMFTGNRPNKTMYKPRRQSPPQRLHVVPPDEVDGGYHRRRPERHDDHQRQSSAPADIEAEERKLIELAMERSLQDNSSLMSVSYRSHERAPPSVTSSGSSLLEMQSSMRSNDDGSSRAGAWKRDGKKWEKVSTGNSGVGGDSLGPINESRGQAARSPYLSPPMTREERLALVEQQMINEAMESSMHGASTPQRFDESPRGYSRDQQHRDAPPRGYPRDQLHRDAPPRGYPRDHPHRDNQFDEEYDLEEQEALQRLEELEREKRRIEQTIVRRGSSRSLRRSQSRCDPGNSQRSSHQSSFRDYPQGNSFRDHDSDSSLHLEQVYEHEHCRGGSSRGVQRHTSHREAYGYREPVDRRAQYQDNHHMSLQSLSFRNNQQLDLFEQSSGPPPPRRSTPPRSHSNPPLIRSTDSVSYQSDNSTKFSQSFASDGDVNHHNGQKFVWKRGPNNAWGRFPPEDNEDDDEDAIVADVLKRSMHER